MPHSEDISSNLAHVYIAQGRLIDAEHLYQAVLKTLPRSSSSRGGSTGKAEDKIVTAYECMAFAQFKNVRHLDSLHSLLRGLHRDPSGLRGWYNVAMVRADLASTATKRKLEKVDDIEDASQQLMLAHKLYGFLSNPNHPHAQRGEPYSTKMAARKVVICEVGQVPYTVITTHTSIKSAINNFSFTTHTHSSSGQHQDIRGTARASESGGRAAQRGEVEAGRRAQSAPTTEARRAEPNAASG